MLLWHYVESLSCINQVLSAESGTSVNNQDVSVDLIEKSDNGISAALNSKMGSQLFTFNSQFINCHCK